MATQSVWSDPPYNVNYANSAKDKLRGKNRAILNDNLGEGFHDFLLDALTPALAHCRGAVYLAMSSSELDTLQSAFRAAGGHWSTFIIWAKNTFTLGRADYQRQYEPILLIVSPFFAKPEMDPSDFRSKKLATLFAFGCPRSSCVRPVSVLRFAAHSNRGYHK